tara:strand:- start:3126 stop:3803 length:678 start_codon:yes stop_codon:yes gene_type:complete
MFFKHKLKIGSRLLNDRVLKNCFLQHPNNVPDYFKQIPSKTKFISLRKNKTLRHCSGFINYFRNLIVIKAPADFEILYDEKGVQETYMGRGILNDGKRFQTHDNAQFLKHVNQNKYAQIGKVMYDFQVQCSVPITVHNPWWHFVDYEVLPGVINATSHFQPLNLFIPLPKDKKHIIIRKDQVLCYLSFQTEKNIKIEYVKDWDTFHEGDYLFSALKKYILPKKIK